MILSDYDKIINENFDISDAPTRKCLVHLTEAEESQMLSALSNALYGKIVGNVDKIDFGTIPRSRGDITKVDGFDNTVECLDIIKKLVIEYRQDTTIVDNVLNAVKNVESRKKMFMKAFATNTQLPVIMYNLIVMSIEQCVSFLIAVCIQYIKDPETKTMKAALDKVAYYNASQNVLYEQIVAFNESCDNLSFDKVMEEALKNKASVKEAVDDIAMVAKIDEMPKKVVVVKVDDDTVEQPKDIPNDVNAEPVHEEDPQPQLGAPIDPAVDTDSDVAAQGDIVAANAEPVEEGGLATVFGIGLGIATAAKAITTLIPKVIIPMMRGTVYFLMYSTLKLSDTLKVQANLIELNAYQLQSASIEDDGIKDKNRAKIVSKQLKIADNLKKLSNKVSLSFNKANKKAKDKIKEDAKKIKVEDIRDDIPADIYNKSVLF